MWTILNNTLQKIEKFLTLDVNTWLLAAWAVLAPIHTVVGATLLLVFADLVTGTLAARKKGYKITSAGFGRSVAKILIYLTAIILGFIVEQFLLGGYIPAGKLIAAVIGLTEFTSILENLDTLYGIPLFQSLVNKFSSSNLVIPEDSNKQTPPPDSKP